MKSKSRLYFLLFIIFVLINVDLFSQISDKYSFQILRFGDSVRIESCIPLEYYSERLFVPNRQQTNLRQIYDFIPMHVIGSKWENNCLIINWPNILNEDILGYIIQFTTLREDQIILSE